MDKETKPNKKVILISDGFEPTHVFIGNESDCIEYCLERGFSWEYISLIGNSDPTPEAPDKIPSAKELRNEHAKTNGHDTFIQWINDCGASDNVLDEIMESFALLIERRAVEMEMKKWEKEKIEMMNQWAYMLNGIRDNMDLLTWIMYEKKLKASDLKDIVHTCKELHHHIYSENFSKPLTVKSLNNGK